MKRIALYTAALAISATAIGAPKAIYVKSGDDFRKYSFLVAQKITLSPDFKHLYLKGYNEHINLQDLKYMSFAMPVESQMTPAQQKDRLISIGQKLNSKINARDVEDIIGMAIEYDNLGSYNGDAIIEKFKGAHPDLFDEDEEYIWANYHDAPMKRLMKAMNAVAKGNAAASRAITEVYTEVFCADELTGVFTANHKTETWEKTADADYFELNYTGLKTGNSYCLRITPSKETTSWREDLVVKDDYYYDDRTKDDTRVDVTLTMPATIKGVMSVNGKEIASATLNTALDQNSKTIKFETIADAQGVYKVRLTSTITNDGITENITLSAKGETIITNEATLNANRLLDFPDWIDAIQGIEEVDEWDGGVSLEPDYKRMAAKFEKAQSNADILGELQIKGHAANFEGMYERLENYLEKNDTSIVIVNHDKGTLKYQYGTPEYTQNIASVYNNYTDASFYYDGKKQLQGFLNFEMSEDLDDYGWTTNGYWDEEKDQYIEFDREYIVTESSYEVAPVLTFSDGSSFAFDSDYFEGGNFDPLVNDYDGIVNTVENIADKFRIERYRH